MPDSGASASIISPSLSLCIPPNVVWRPLGILYVKLDTLVRLASWCNTCNTSKIHKQLSINNFCHMKEKMVYDNISFSFIFIPLTLSVGWQEGHPTCKIWVLACWTVGGDNLTGALHVIQLKLSPPPPSSSSPITIQNGDILILANPGPRGKMAVKTEKEHINFQWVMFITH